MKIDWGRGYNSLDKELRQITRDAETGGHLADKLFRVWMRNGFIWPYMTSLSLMRR
ncbi:hypothetical protein [Desulfonema magnum]|uniref:Uncharacterized protein n=1 Tax=Desulfonema magnum TaxID=45655 RepID=A0A975BQX9_9BACT|nr:hypothetical protein [Desulfonema magnum]QTA90214.1 Uncharacterized protein dnm_062750 [Desulfonema magnum]